LSEEAWFLYYDKFRLKIEQFTFQTPVRLVLGWLDCYCHFQIHTRRK